MRLFQEQWEEPGESAGHVFGLCLVLRLPLGRTLCESPLSLRNSEGDRSAPCWRQTLARGPRGDAPSGRVWGEAGRGWTDSSLGSGSG